VTLLVVATYPVSGGPVFMGPVTCVDGTVSIGGDPVPSAQGTSAMLGAACVVADHLGLPAPFALVAGDIGRGEGTRAVFARLAETCASLCPDVVAFHYMQPVMALMRSATEELDSMLPGVSLVADAGGMYAAKAAGLAPRFSLMTPDVGELGFLADPAATHPAYVSHYLFGTAGFDPAGLARRAFETGGSARALLIKGAVDRVVLDGVVAATIDAPDVPALEAVGGTGDTITGLAAAFMAAGFPVVEAARCAALANRHAGERQCITPAMSARDLIAAFPEVLSKNLCRWGGACV